MKNLLVLSIIGLLFVGMSAFRPNKLADGDTVEKINWMSIEDAIAASQKNPKKIMIDVYTDWCGWCKRMDATTFSQADIVSYVNEHYYAVKLNAEQRETITLGDEQYEFVANGNRGYNQLAAVLLQGKLSFPSMVFLGEDFANLSIVPGYQTAPKMDKILHFFAENHYKTTPWADFDASFVSKIAE
ncbi:MAG: DUF255 domain-containing protein [Chitinophagales bacterium]|nr:DUF255 domain-containing protein [Bacteroidota bacterium]MCB9043960.1 DUF255 domain-containing protein [Chitinophagales bacterium]